MSTILSLITSRLAGPLALVGCAVLAFMLVGSKMETHQWKTKATGYERAIYDAPTGYIAKLTQCRTNAASLEASLGRQNAAVASWKAEADRRAAEAGKAAREAAIATAEANRRAGAVMAAKAGADQCASADGLILDSLR